LKIFFRIPDTSLFFSLKNAEKQLQNRTKINTGKACKKMNGNNQQKIITAGFYTATFT
jgi:hypothetical protein